MSKKSLNFDSQKRRFQAMVGTGGIGAGSLFLLTGNHTLGREESRGGKYLDARDYCKLHIITHYVKVLAGDDFPIFPIGKVGDDEVGHSIYAEMERAGLDMRFVGYAKGEKTLFGFCFLYPDGTGGNLTTEESACTKVDPLFVESSEEIFSKYGNQLIALSAAEVPIAARRKLLQLTRKYKGFNVASFTSGEMAEAEETGMLQIVDLLAMNIHEAAALTRMDVSQDTLLIVNHAIAKMQSFNASIMLSITAGKQGSWAWDGSRLTHVGIFPVVVKSSAGAGDAHIAGIITGLVNGMSLQQAQLLGSLAAAFSVTSQHTIHPTMSKKNLLHLAQQSGNDIDPLVIEFLSENG